MMEFLFNSLAVLVWVVIASMVIPVLIVGFVILFGLYENYWKKK